VGWRGHDPGLFHDRSPARGENLDFLTSSEAARGDYGTFVEAGNYWGDVFAGERSLGSDLGEIWDWIWD